MARISELLTNDLKVPPRLFHYTSQQGLIGILSSKTLWSTRTQYLNDSTEFGYTVELLKNAVEARRERGGATTPNLNVPLICDAMAKAFNRFNKIPTHVACFSQDRDALVNGEDIAPIQEVSASDSLAGS